MSKKLWIGFVAVFVFFQICDYLIHGVILSGAYQKLMTDAPGMFRPEMKM